MASKLPHFWTKAAQYSKLFSYHARTYYNELMEENKHFIKNPPTVETCRKLSNQLFYTRLASIPGRYESFGKELDYVKQLAKGRHTLTYENLGIATLFGIECLFWHSVGEDLARILS